MNKNSNSIQKLYNWACNCFISENAPIISFAALCVFIFEIVLRFIPNNTLQNIIFVFILSLFIAFLILWIIFKNAYVHIHLHKEAPERYNVENTLEYIGEKKAELEVVGRTCFRWLCGDERETDKTKIKNNKDILKAAIYKAICSGAKIDFVIQHPHYSVPFFSLDETDKLKKQAYESIGQFLKIKKSLFNQDEKDKLTMKLTKKLNDPSSSYGGIIENSMVRLKEGGKTKRIVFDITMNFLKKDTKDKDNRKPFIVFESKKDTSKEKTLDSFEREFDFYNSKSEAIEVFINKKSEGSRKVKELEKEYKHYSILRNDKSKLLTRSYAKWLNTLGVSASGELQAPVSIQLLITNRCSTRCLMCNHYDLYIEAEELQKQEIMNCIDMIDDLGTKNIIISGGEPLMNPNLFEILKYIKSKGIKTGLLTNGLKKDGEPLTEKEANDIKNNCEWVQLSIDSFNKEIYEKIRRGGKFENVLKSFNNLYNTGFKNFEICYTIQQENIEEVNELVRLTKDIVKDIPIRLKFAHGPENGQRYLCNEKQITKLIQSMDTHNKKFNYNYLSSMIGTYFSAVDLSTGEPVKKKIHEYSKNGDKCQILKLSLKINANGDVYPCCFLFDDNTAKSEFRKRHKVGTLRKENVVHPCTDGNSLKEIWQGEKMKTLRNKTMPIDDKACNYCTRHFYQNEFLNKLSRIVDEYYDYGIIDNITRRRKSNNEQSYWL